MNERDPGPAEDRNRIEQELGGRDAALAEDEAAGNPGLEADRESIEVTEPDFMEEPLPTDVIEAVEDDPVYAPPVDPVLTSGAHGETQALGGVAPSALDPDLGPEPSAEDTEPGDEALADAIRAQLRLDAATTDLADTVVVTVRKGVAYLDGAVPGMEDAENVEAVAADVPGVQDVVEALLVREI
jgi:hypothetical protein